ncbi:unnamed protein product [Cuscuta europaea]|uniref:Uncharacterized protein n=1 Tax=Cuscuta europaea TaxID=41803 RepID=A0A9P1EAB7_CUSEU|nr:unnamed protein product [Cuscuta europaea]
MRWDLLTCDQPQEKKASRQPKKKQHMTTANSKQNNKNRKLQSTSCKEMGWGAKSFAGKSNKRSAVGEKKIDTRSSWQQGKGSSLQREDIAAGRKGRNAGRKPQPATPCSFIFQS